MNDVTNWKVPKWPFLLGDALLIIFGFILVRHSPLPAHWAGLAAGCVVIGAILGVMPFILDYRAMGKALEVNALGAVAEKIENLEKLAGQISAATNQWSAVQESVQGNADKTVVAAKAIADRMAEEIRQFSEFLKKANDSEKAALRLEVEKSRRGEQEWLQVLVNILDHTYALHAAAMRSGEVKFAAPITTFQNTCRDTARRLGLASFAAEPNEPFNAERHQAAGSKEPPPAGATVAETINPGYTFQGRLLRPALVRLQTGNAPAEKTPGKPAAAPPRPPENPGDHFKLESAN
jgi:molecular chaperone GrpE (heat shock protein)